MVFGGGYQQERVLKEGDVHGNSLAVWWLGLCSSTAGGTGSILVRELRSCMLHSTAETK